MRKRVLLIDDEPGVRSSLKMALEPEHEVLCAADAPEGLELFRRESPHLVLLDLALPGADGLSLLATLHTEDPPLPVIMLTATKTVRTAVAAMKLGAVDYVTKPFDVEELRLIVAKALAARELEEEVRTLRAQVSSRYGLHNLIGRSPAMQEVYTKIAQLADGRTTVLITGESGTGKELVARALHYNSIRRHGPFVALNCAALPETLIESELFGHERGAYTDAVTRRIGQFELAHGGTLFLDEIGDLSPATQAKLLRVLQEREFVRIGGTQPIRVDVRIVAATNKSLEDLVRQKAFREDLYYRINVVSLRLPPLRERREDIPLLARHLLDKRLEADKRPPQRFSPAAMDLLVRHHWPGNVRELENVIEQILVWSRGPEILPDHLPASCRGNGRAPSLREEVLSGRISLAEAVTRFERDLILDALERTRHVQTRAAALLGISRRMLKYRIDLLGLQRGEGPGGQDEPLRGEV
jgi:DNA-binding NtrC family response regulator